MDQDAHMRRIIDNLSTDLNNLSSESKRKYAPVKEASEACLLKLRQINSLKTNLYKTMCDSSSEVIKPLILGCDTKQPKIIQICLTSVQKVVEAKILNVSSASSLINILWILTESGLEELKVLQTIILIVTTTDVVKHNLLAKTLTIGFRLAASKDLIVMNTATAMLSQMVTKVFERVVTESKSGQQQQQSATAANATTTATGKTMDMDQLKTLSKEPPGWMSDTAQDAYMLLQDIYLLLNSDQSLWLINVNEINKPFGLELLKSILVRYPDIFFMNPEMCFVLKERICPLLIKLFSPSTKLKASAGGGGGGQQGSPASAASASLIEQLQKNANYFAVVSRLIRIVFVLIKSYFDLLITENEIFLSLLTKFLDIDRPLWQKALAIEVFHKISVETRLIESLVVNYDMKQHPEKIFSLITSGIALFIQSLFLNAATSAAGGSAAGAGGQSGGGGSASAGSGQSPSSQQLMSGAGSGLGGGSSGLSMSSSSSIYQQQQQSNAYAFQISSAQPSFIYKDTTIQLLFPYISGQVKATYLDTWDKLDVPYIQDGYLLSVGFATLQELCKTVQTLIEQNLTAFHQQQQEQQTAAAASTPDSVAANASQNLAPINFNKSLKRLTQDPASLASSGSAQLQECFQLMSSSCNSFLFVYNILLESSLDETITEQIIKTIRSFVYISSLLNMNAQRDAFVTSMCKAALPANYAHYVLNLKSIADLNYLVQQQPPQSVAASQTYYPKATVGGVVGKAGSRIPMPAIDDSSERQIQVVAIGPALHVAPNSSSSATTTSPTSIAGAGAGSAGQVNSTLLITAKNLLVMKSILNMSQLYSELIGSSWYIILNTIQHLTWTLSLKPQIGSNGQLRHSSALGTSSSNAASSSSLASSGVSSNAGAGSGLNSSLTTAGSMLSDAASGAAGGSMITTAIQTEIAFICNMLSKLFETSRALSDQSFKDMIDALLQLAVECSDLAYLRNEPCLFAVAKLYETSVSNLHRIDQFWPHVTMHLLCSCKHTNVKYREWCVDSICNMIRATFNYKYSLGSPSSSSSAASLALGGAQIGPGGGGGGEMGSVMRHNILQPLHELSAIPFNDVRQKQIECTLSILRLMGQHLNESWPVCLNIIGAIQPGHTEGLIRAAFQCLQLVVTDFLSMIRANYLSLVINVVAKFGSQEQDLNISLTAIVLLWNISDYMFQNSERLNEEIKKTYEAGELQENGGGLAKAGDVDYSSIKDIETVWMVLYSRLGHLCVDPRPAVRKSAGQTLFCTISSHGSVLGVDSHWKDLVWNVLFPLLDEVRVFTSTASRERDKHASNPNFLMHHSRDTAEKQWAETSVLTLAGVTRVFNSKCWILMKLANNEFHRMWVFLLNIIEMSALSRNSEIALSALRGFHELLGNQNYFSSAASFAGASNSTAQTFAAAASAASVVNANPTSGSPSTSGAAAAAASNTASNAAASAGQNCAASVNSALKMFDIVEWLAAWRTWSNIGNSLLQSPSASAGSKATSNGSPATAVNGTPPTPSNNAAANNNSINNWPPPTQTFLTCYIDLVPVLVEKLAPVSKFTSKDFENFSLIIDKLLSVPVLSSDYSSFILMQVDNNLTPLQNTSLNTMRSFIKLLKTADAEFQRDFIPLVFERLLSFSLYACYNSNPLFTASNAAAANGSGPTSNGAGGEHKSSPTFGSGGHAKPSEVVTINFVPFGEKSLLMASGLYEEWAQHEVVVETAILRSIIQTLYVPMSLKYSCPSATTWKLSVECLFGILKKALPIAFKNKPQFETMWLDLAKTFEDFLFTKNVAPEDAPMEVTRKDELIDCQIIELIRDKILAQSAHLPQQFIQKILAILNRGSIYSNPFENVIDLDAARSHREDFSKTCFEALLRFSFIGPNESGAGQNGGPNGGGDAAEGSLTRMALSSMLSRCKEIIQRYTNDERTNGRVPLPRPRINEMICVLRALCTLISALKKAPKDTVQGSIWNQVIGLYPCLVECASSPTPQIIEAIKDTLHHYFSLLRAPQ